MGLLCGLGSMADFVILSTNRLPSLHIGHKTTKRSESFSPMATDCPASNSRWNAFQFFNCCFFLRPIFDPSFDLDLPWHPCLFPNTDPKEGAVRRSPTPDQHQCCCRNDHPASRSPSPLLLRMLVIHSVKGDILTLRPLNCEKAEKASSNSKQKLTVSRIVPSVDRPRIHRSLEVHHKRQAPQDHGGSSVPFSLRQVHHKRVSSHTLRSENQIPSLS